MRVLSPNRSYTKTPLYKTTLTSLAAHANIQPPYVQELTYRQTKRSIPLERLGYVAYIRFIGGQLAPNHRIGFGGLRDYRVG
mgnify:CR=1 FL=1